VTMTITGSTSSSDDTTTTDDGGGNYNATATVSYVSTGSTTSTKKKVNKCFAGSETVTLGSGQVVPISDVSVGDVVLASDATGVLKYSKVIAVPHERNSERATFTQVTVASGRDLKLTADHLMLVAKDCQHSELLSASEVTVGMCAVTVGGMERVAAVKHDVAGEGIYTIVAADAELVVVSGFVASPFAVNHAVANAYYNVVRALPSSVMDIGVIKQASVFFGSLMSGDSLSLF